MNSVQQFKISSLDSFATRILGSTSLIILLTEALGKVNSSSSPDPAEAILRSQYHKLKTMRVKFNKRLLIKSIGICLGT